MDLYNQIMKTLRILVIGKVQGVWFRRSTQKMALKFGLKGTVQNLEDERVEIVASGSKEGLVKLIEWSKKGPELAKVKDVLIEEKDFILFKDFQILRQNG